MAIKSEQKAEADETHKHVEEDRRLLIQVSVKICLKSDIKKKKTSILIFIYFFIY